MKSFWENIKLIIVILSIPIWMNVGASCARAHADSYREPKFKIAIIDSGYDASLIKNGPKLKLCKTGHFDFSTGQPEVGSTEPHGTYVAAVIAKELEQIDYCAVIYNVMSKHHREMATENVVSAFYKASYQGLAAINASYNGYIQTVSEREAVKDAAKRVDKIFVSAGNDHQNLDDKCDAFPTCFDIPNMYSVGALTSDHTRKLEFSNYGARVKLWFDGVYSEDHRGTSFAAPRALASYIKELKQTLDANKL